MQNNIKINDDFQEIGTRTMDERNRLTLGEIFKDFKRIRLYKNDRGEVLLRPIVEIPASELWLFQNSEAFESVQKGLKDASEGKITKINLDELQDFKLFEIFLTVEARDQLNRLKTDKGLERRYNAVKKTIGFLSSNPRHKSLKTHEFTSLKGPSGEKVFEAYAEQSTPAAYRIFWYYGPNQNQITIIAITPHP